jgi:hypothetical protein
MCLNRLPIGSHLPDENVTLTELALNNSPSGHRNNRVSTFLEPGHGAAGQAPYFVSGYRLDPCRKWPARFTALAAGVRFSPGPTAIIACDVLLCGTNLRDIPWAVSKYILILGRV